MEPATIGTFASVASKIIAAGFKGYDWITNADHKSELGVLQGTLDAVAGGLGLHKTGATEADAQFLALVLTAFGRAFENYWAGAKNINTGQFSRFWDRDERARQQDIEHRLRVAGLKLPSVAAGPPAKKELTILDGLIHGPLRNTYYNALWSAFSDPGISDPPLDPATAREFERLFMLAYWEGLQSEAGKAVQGYREALQVHRTRLVQEMLLADLASWGNNHVFGNLRSDQYDSSQGIPFLRMDDLYIEPDGRIEKLWEPEQAETPIIDLLKSVLDEPQEGPVLVKAHFGLGKSMTARRLARDLADEFLRLPASSVHIRLPIFIRCADDFVGDTFHLETIVRRAWQRQVRMMGLQLKVDDPAFALPGGDQRTLFILDGLDEVSLDHRHLEDLFERLKENTDDRWRFLVFSRPEALPKPRFETPHAKANKETPRIEVLPFSENATEVQSGQIQRWLAGWNRHVRLGKPAISVDDLMQRDLLELARTPILLFMIAHSWDEAPSGEGKLSKTDLYERFFQQIARGKARADREQHPRIFQASKRLLECLVSKGELGNDAENKEPDAMLWLLSRVAWKAHQIAPKVLQKLHVENIVSGELDADRDAIAPIMGGVLLTLQADLSKEGGDILFGHQSFREFLVARYWAQQLKKIAESSGHKRHEQEKSLLGGRLLGAEDKSFSFLMPMLKGESGQWPVWSPLAWSQRQREKLFDWAQDYFNDESLFSLGGASLSIQNDQRALFREAALAIGCHVADTTPTIKADHPYTLRSLLAWFWQTGNEALIFAPRADLSAARLHGASLEGANLSGANLSGVNFEGARLFRANLGGANLSGVNFEGADLTGANLSGAILERTDFTGAMLSRADLRGCQLRGAYFQGGYLSGIILSGANLEGAKFFGHNLEGANLEGANLRGANLEGANVRRANLRGSDLCEASLKGAHYNSTTIWPDGFDLETAGVVFDDTPDDDIPFLQARRLRLRVSAQACRPGGRARWRPAVHGATSGSVGHGWGRWLRGVV